ncbi:hypothetical protein [Streptodolium elevatio]|uniref:Uncharacterized protein n=1 Tax=Streptodolium elevatio TaxID=3157996 RepID=A0ABV3DG54_9ACTN
MPTPDDHLQDPQLARALRDLDLPGPVVPSLTADEVRRKGTRRRSRRHAAWAGSGLVAAALVGALVMGPLTPDRSGRGPTSAAASPEQVADPPAPTAAQTPQTAPASPETTTGDPTLKAATPPVATLDIGGMTLTTHAENGALQGYWFDVYISGTAFDQFAKNPLTLQITGLYRTLDLAGYGAELGKDTAVAVPWVVTASATDGTEVYIGSPPVCMATAAKCPADQNRQGLIGLFGEERAKQFYDSVRFGDRIEVVGVYGKGPVTTTDSDARGKNEPRATTPSATGRAETAAPTTIRPTRSGTPGEPTEPTGVPGTGSPTATAVPSTSFPSGSPPPKPTGGASGAPPAV